MIGLLLLLLAQVPDPLPTPAVARLGTVRFRHAQSVTSAAWTPDGTRIASIDGAGDVALWERDGRPVARWRAHQGTGGISRC